jgi:WD40 repeat protein
MLPASVWGTNDVDWKDEVACELRLLANTTTEFSVEVVKVYRRLLAEVGQVRPSSYALRQMIKMREPFAIPPPFDSVTRQMNLGLAQIKGMLGAEPLSESRLGPFLEILEDLAKKHERADLTKSEQVSRLSETSVSIPLLARITLDSPPRYAQRNRSYLEFRQLDPPKFGVSPDGRWVAAKVGDSIQVWEARSGSPISQSVISIPIEFRFTEDGQSILVGSEPGHIQVHDVLTGARRRDMKEARDGWGPSGQLLLSSDGRYLVSTSHMGYTTPCALRVWDLTRDEEPVFFKDVEGDVETWVRQGDQELLVIRGPQRLWGWNPAQPEKKPFPLNSKEIKGEFQQRDAGASPYFLNRMSSQGVEIWKVASGAATLVREIGQELRYYAFASKGDTFIAYLPGNRQLLAIDLKSSTESLISMPDTEYVTAIALSPDGAIASLATSTGQLEFWRLKDHELIASVSVSPHNPYHAQTVAYLEFSNEGQLLFAQNRGSTLEVRDVSKLVP